MQTFAKLGDVLKKTPHSQLYIFSQLELSPLAWPSPQPIPNKCCLVG